VAVSPSSIFEGTLIPGRKFHPSAAVPLPTSNVPQLRFSTLTEMSLDKITAALITTPTTRTPSHTENNNEDHCYPTLACQQLLHPSSFRLPVQDNPHILQDLVQLGSTTLEELPLYQRLRLCQLTRTRQD